MNGRTSSARAARRRKYRRRRFGAAVIALAAVAAAVIAVRHTGRDEVREVSPTFYPTVHTMTMPPEPTETPTPTPGPVTTAVRIIPSLGDDVDPEPTPEPTPEPFVVRTSTEEIELIARTIWGEAEGISSTTERAAVAWCVLNRVDAWGQSITEVVTAPMQFHGYAARRSGTVPEEYIELAEDVVERWEREKAGETDVGRVLPAEYIYFEGDTQHNYYRTAWSGGSRWWWEADSPYED